MTNYYDSGLYLEPFFTKHKHLELDYCSIHQELIDSDDFPLYAEYYGDDLDCEDDDKLRQQVSDLVLERISYWSTYFEPLIFSKKIALECNLIPFVHHGVKLLALSGCGMDLSPTLDAYQALTNNTIDKGSRLFSDNAYFEHVVGSYLAEKVKQAVSYDVSIIKDKRCGGDLMNNRLIDWNEKLRISPFYKTHKISFGDICANRLQNIDYNFTLLARHYLNHVNNAVESYNNLELIRDKVKSALSWDLSTWDLYFEPLIFDEELALECDLIPFSFRGVKFLSSTGHRIYYSYRIDAYEVLTCGSMNKDSSYFKENEKAYFRYIIGEDVHQRIVKVLEAS